MALPPISRPRTAAVAGGVALALLVAIGAAVREWPAWHAARDARQALADGRHGDALRAAERWIRERPGSAQAHFLRAKAALALGRRRDFVDAMVRAQALGQPEGDLAVLRAMVDAQAGRLDQARPVLVRAFREAAEPDPMVDETLARVLMELYAWPEAGAVLTRWGEHAPRDHRPPLWHAIVGRRRDADPEAIADDFREALRRTPDLPEARLGLAEELARAGHPREAAAEYQAYLARNPDDPAAQLGAGRVAVELGDLDLALDRFRRALALDPDNAEAHMELARFARLRGDEAEALGHLDRAIALRPYDLAPRHNRRIALARLGRPAEALREQQAMDRLKADLAQMDALRERLNQVPDDPNLQARLARWMFDHGFDQEALKWSGKILNEHPGHRETCSLLAGYYEKRGDYELAASYQARISAPPPR